MPSVDPSAALDLKLKHHLSYAQIAVIQGVTKQAIHQRIKDLLPTPETKVWQDHRADILAHLQLKLLSFIDNEKLKKTPVGSLILAMCQLYDKERLERGQSTANHAISISIAEEDRIREIAIALSRSKIIQSEAGGENPPLLSIENYKELLEKVV